VMIYALLLANRYKLDVEDIILKKIKKNAEKYPVKKAYGSAKKYNEL
ncbi:MAG: MazG-like family protein, partial [Bacilli bacterium]